MGGYGGVPYPPPPNQNFEAKVLNFDAKVLNFAVFSFGPRI